MSTIPRIEQELDPNITPIPTHVGKNTFFVRLRAGYHIQTGSDPNDKDSFLHGPIDLPVTPAMAIAHMSKWEDPNAVKMWLSTAHPKLIMGKPHLQPRREKRITPQERLDKDIKAAQALNASRDNGASGGVSIEEVKALIRAQFKPLQAQMDQVLSALGAGSPTAGLGEADDEKGGSKKKGTK